MADGISIPGVSNKYGTNETIKALMELERKPLVREQEQLEKYQSQQGAWRDVSQKMSSLRESVKSLYSVDNPFNNKLTESSDENAITADAARSAEYGTFNIDVVKPATADRFLSGSISKNFKVEEGKYTFGVGTKTVTINWKGGKIADFITAVNKRGNNLIKASLIGVSSNKKSVLLESLKTGAENRLVLQDKALDLAKSIDMVGEAKTDATPLSSNTADYTTPETNDLQPQANMPALSVDGVSSDGSTITIPARGGADIPLPQGITEGTQKVTFSFATEDTEDITTAVNAQLLEPELPVPGSVDFRGLTVSNEQSDTLLVKPEAASAEPVQPVNDDTQFIAIRNEDGTEIPVDITEFPVDEETGQRKVTLSMEDYPGAVSLIIRNNNTGKQITMSVPETYDASKTQGFEPVHAVSVADDAVFKYEGITLTRPSNDVDDVIPNVTLHLHNKTEKTATLKVTPDTESAKNALITFVGKYNQVLAEINVLTTNKPEVIAELDYLTDDERDAEEKKLGLFMGDFSLTNGKSTMQQTVSANYRFADNAEITMLNQIGISTNASSGTGGYSASQMRGYLEVEEKTLDSMLESKLEDIKNLFGYDSDGDLIIDNGLGYRLDKQITSWTQSGGIISTKTATLDKQIKSSNTKISKLESQLDAKESELKAKYAGMESSLNNLEKQQSSIENFSRQQSNNKN